MKTSVFVTISRPFTHPESGEGIQPIFATYENCSIAEYFEKYHCKGDIVESIEKIEPLVK